MKCAGSSTGLAEGIVSAHNARVLTLDKSMTATLEIDFPPTLLLHAKDSEALRQRSRFLLALKYFELGELSSGQAAKMCGLDRFQFLTEAASCGVPAVEMTGEELEQEFPHG